MSQSQSSKKTVLPRNSALPVFLFIVVVSFYGDGYIHLRTVEASIQTLLHVRFRTSSQAGMLFLAAGRRDFLLLELISGRLQVRLDLGSGERSLRSEKGIHLSDLAWHSIELTHNRHNVNMTLDRNFHTSFRMPGPDLELSVENGLFVGGAAGLNHPYLFNISTGFRGCIDEVVFNEHNLLSSLRPYSGYKSVHEVSLGCSPQFSATEEDSVSFFSSKAFITLPPWEGPQEGVFECELYPSAREEDGMVLFSSGNQGGFVAIEIKDGNLVATVGNGEGSKTELRSLTHVHSNHTWYPIQLHLLPNSVQLKVGEELIKATLSLELQVIQLKGPLFLGGLDEEAQGEAQRAGLMSAVSGGQKAGQGVSFKGCLREIRVNTQRTGLPHAAITKDITVGCNRGQATNALATTSPTNRPEFDVTTTRPITNNKKNPNFLMLRKLEVVEGGWASLEPKHIRVNLDFRKLGIHPSQLMTITIGAEEVDRTFSMLDLWQGRVMYVHSGSEDQYDFFMFSVFSSSKKKLPVFLKSNRLHRFDISISPANDAPVLSLPEGNLFTLLEKSKRQVGKAECLDKLTGLHISSRAINLFSLNDLEGGKISFVHTGVPHSRLALRVSDGLKVSNVLACPRCNKPINCDIKDVRYRVGAFLAMLMSFGLSVLKIRYDVTELPQYGELQRLHSSGDWKRTTYFSQKLLEKERIRYLSTYHGLQTQNNITDYFKCKISIGSTAAKEVVFLIRVHWIQFKVTRSKMEVNGVQTAAVTPEDLHVISKGVKLNESDLYFRLLTVPNKGQLFLDNKVLVRNSTFSQKNITDGLMKYELLNMLHDDTRDTFSFQVFSAHANSTTYDFRINIHAESTVITVVNKGLSTLEGGSKVINKEILFTHTASNQEVHYSITVSPRHGQIRRINLSNSTSINDNIVTFTNQDIIEERIMYVHDDSETKQDSFNFQIMVYKPHKRTSKKEDRNIVEHTFNISVQLVNDQRPVRVVDKVFHVARNGQRLVTLTDIRYRDDDSDFQDNWLVYTRRGIPMGELVLASDTSHKLYEFTQRDLQQKKVLFVHRGVSFGRFVLFVSDGKHYVSTLLEVMAQDPYLQVENNTGIVVKRGGLTTMTSANLSIFSNLDIRDPQEVTFEVFLPPKHGVLCFNNGSCETVTGAKPISIFTQQDLVAGRLAYRHDSTRDKSTDGGMDRERREVHLDIGVMVKIYLESHQRPPTVISNRPVVVAEGQNVSISKEHLEVICLLRSSMQGFTEQPTNSFTQEDLNQGMIIYHQQSAGHTNDSVLLEATNGLTKVGPIRLEIDIIPMLLPLQVQNECLDVRVPRKRKRGKEKLIFPTKGLINLLMFARRSLQVEREYISYIHDGSDTLRDNFTIVANQTEIRKHSLPCTAHISVIPVNDETPVVTTNKGLKVWVGSVTEITKDDLRAEDLDTPESEGLEFIITPPSNGHLALKSAPSRHILNFTQNHIETRQLMFVHSGASSGGFHFQVNDGVNFTPRQIFSTTAYSMGLTLQRNHPMEVYPGKVLQSKTWCDTLELCVYTCMFSFAQKESLLFISQIKQCPFLICLFFVPQVNDGVILYDQNKPQSVGWSAADSFSFTVSSPPAFLPPHIFTILISYQANKHHNSAQHKTRLLNNAGAVVAEGGRVTIDRSKLDASNLLGKVPEPHRKAHQILYRVISLPQHGTLTDFFSFHRNQPDFSQVTLNKYGITYVHDDSETTSDSFTFRAWVALLDLSSSSLLAVTETFSIAVTPVNDQPPLIRSRARSMKVVDHDTPPEELHYLVISKPNNGYLTLGERPEPVTSFTQYDVNHGRLHFIQQVNFVWGVVHMKPICPSVSMVNNTGLSLVQGRTAVILTTNRFAAQTNSRTQAIITYTVTTHPRHGRIAINDQEVTTFSHEDLEFGRVVYHMTDFSESEDSFQVSVSASSPGVAYGNVTGQTVNVTVRALIYLREPVRVPSGIAVKLGKAMIDASELARISRADPVFEVLSPPKHGKLVKMTYDPNRASQVLTSFTFRDLHDNKSALTTVRGHAPATPLNDSFIFLLKAGNVQPAKGELHFTILPHHQMHHGPSSLNTEGASHEHTTTWLPTHNKTTTGRGGGRGGPTTLTEVGVGLPPHILSHKNHNRTQHKLRPNTRWGNHTSSGSHGGRSGSHSHVPQPHTPSVSDKHGPAIPPDIHPVHVEVLPRPASDPLHIILPLLACLFLIIILVILILVFRRRKEKQARLRLLQQLATVALHTEDSPYLGRAERSVAMPSVVVTPLCPVSCPSSPRVLRSPRRSLAPGMTFWGPFEADGAGGDGNIRGDNNNERGNVTAGFRTSLRSRSLTPTLKDNQYWV
uniref:Laminin G domain-containing protein n=1 Tax=Sander lucioperca TaxID=283035 RepID=A0A8C9X8C9_SANLU